MPELAEHETGQGFHAAIAGQTPVQLRFQVAQIHAAIHHHRFAGAAQNRMRRRVEFVLKLARKLLDGIFRRHQPHRGAILVHHDGEVAAVVLEIA